MRSRPDSYVEDTLRSIEQRVLQEIRIAAPHRITAMAAAATLAVAAAGRWWSAGGLHPVAHGAAGVLPVTTGLLLLAVVISALALRAQRFRWCCAAVFSSWLGSVAAVAGLWWHRTTPAPDPMIWTLICAIAVGVLTLTWLLVVLTPIERSHPDMRARYTVEE
ncbi:MAG: hypothetical protein DIU75_011385 [Mycolicibacterium hassiacum]|jgi:hypothetical protein